MASQAVMAAVKARVGAAIGDCPILWENEEGDAPSDGAEFIVIQYPVGSTRRWSVTDRYYRESGTIRFVIHVPVGTGTERASALSETIGTMFRDRAFGGVKTLVPSPPTEGEGDGNYSVTSMSCPYTRDFRD